MAEYKSAYWDFPHGPVVKNLPANTEDKSSIPGQGTKILHVTGQLVAAYAISCKKKKRNQHIAIVIEKFYEKLKLAEFKGMFTDIADFHCGINFLFLSQPDG